MAQCFSCLISKVQRSRGTSNIATSKFRGVGLSLKEGRGRGTWDVGRGTWDVGRGTWDVGRGDVGRGDAGTRGRGDAGTRGRGDAVTWGRGDALCLISISIHSERLDVLLFR